MNERVIEHGGATDCGPCECCGNESRRVWGYVHRGDETEAAYFVHWTLGHVDDHGANFDLIVGRWGEGAEASERWAASLELTRTPNGSQFTVIDAAGRNFARSKLVGKSLARSDVIGTPLAQQIFDIVDVIWLQDERISEIRGDQCC